MCIVIFNIIKNIVYMLSFFYKYIFFNFFIFFLIYNFYNNEINFIRKKIRLNLNNFLH